MWLRRISYGSKHVCITGGSEGLGLSLASLFIQEPSTCVTLISRSQTKLLKAKEILQATIEEGSLTSSVFIFTGDVCDPDSIAESLNKAEMEVGPIDVLICNAGMSLPGRFLDARVDSFKRQMEVNYLGTVYSVRGVVERMTQRRRGEIVLISSALGVVGMTGYASYAPTKWAIRGFADCLRMELQAFGVKVRIAYPPDMDTPGYRAELQLTPPEVLDIMKASGDTVFQPLEVAKAIIKGMKGDRYHLPSPDLLQSFSQATMTGVSPAPYFLPFQALLCAICVFVSAYFVSTFDRITQKHVKNHKP